MRIPHPILGLSLIPLLSAAILAPPAFSREPPAPAPVAQPVLTIPTEIRAIPGDWLVVSPQTNCVAVVYVGLDGLSAFPSGELRDARKFIVNLPRGGQSRYRFTAVGTLGDQLVQTPFAIVTYDAPGPPPVPPAPPAPAPVLGAVGMASRSGLAAVPAASRQASAVKLAAAHRDLATALTAGAGKYAAEEAKGAAFLAEAVLNDKRERNRAALGADAANWSGWTAVLDPTVKAAYDAGQLRTQAAWAAALNDIAAGLGG
jgi:hypothetical protein